MSKVLVDKENLTQQLGEEDGVVERQRMIESMCLTWRHDFGLNKPEDCEFSSGMTVAEREHLRGQMAKLFDHHFGPALSAVTAERDRLRSKWARVESERDRLIAEVGALRKDAERYRMFRRGMFDPDRFDADIDAAMAAKEG